MRQGVKAFLLSALVFPGLGQLYNQDRKKGVVLVLGANLLLGVVLLVGMVLISQEYLAVFYPRPLTWKLVHLLLVDSISHPFFLIPFALLMALWGYAMVDAVRSAGRTQPAADQAELAPRDPD
jgi:hypothetical protein